MGLDLVELVGYAASALIVVSLMMSSLLRLRVINLVGSATFAVYAVLIGSLPVLLTNAAITAINVHHLLRIWRDRSADAYFEVVDVEPGSAVLRRFVEHHAEDIARFQPEFPGIRPDHRAWMVLRDAVPVGAVLARPLPDGGLHVDLDFVTEAHRDLGPGSAVFGPGGPLGGGRVPVVRSAPGSAAHRRYLQRLGFVPGEAGWERR